MASPPQSLPQAPLVPDPVNATADSADLRYRPLFALSPQPAWVYDTRSLGFLEVNEAALRSYGWSRDEFLAMSLRDIRPPSSLGELDALLAATPDRDRHASQALHRTKSGTLRRVEIHSYPLEFDGRAARMVLVHDITDRIAADAALLFSEQKYRSLIEQLQDVFFRTDAHGLWTFLNPAWTTLTGHPVEESLGTHYLAYVHPSDRAALLDAFRPLGDGSEEHMIMEARYFRRDGGYRWVEASARAVIDEHGGAAGTSGTLRDITECGRRTPSVSVSRPTSDSSSMHPARASTGSMHGASSRSSTGAAPRCSATSRTS